MESELLEQKKPVHIVFDALDFKWENVPATKYDNFMKMRDIEANPHCFHVEGYPYMLQIEPTNRCNLQCPLCPAGTNRLERERRDLTLDEFKTIIDDMEDYLLFLILWEWGEPFKNLESFEKNTIRQATSHCPSLERICFRTYATGHLLRNPNLF